MVARVGGGRSSTIPYQGREVLVVVTVIVVTRVGGAPLLCVLDVFTH